MSRMDIDHFDSITLDTMLSGNSDWMEGDLLETLSKHPLDCVETEFPHHVSSMDSPDDYIRPTEQHPTFYGCYDWHSAVHSHWSLIRLLRLFDDHPRASDIIESIETRFTTENIEQEVEYFESHNSFEKPYGWGWFLRLVAELSLWDNQRGDEWRAILEPLEETIVKLVKTEFLSQDRPFRVGTHLNSAFALQCIFDYARVTKNNELEAAVSETSRDFFRNDRDYPVEYEPFGWDFISPGLTEADLMRRVLDGEEFETWIDTVLPDITIA
ncbi:MAG: DUF2891 domain-containing protein, partial [Halobacteriaceae archaeon]